MPLPLKTLGFVSGAAALAGLLVLAPPASADIDLWPTLKKHRLTCAIAGWRAARQCLPSLAVPLACSSARRGVEQADRSL